MKKALLHLNHALIKSLIQPNDVVVDMTCGNGNDTEFLASLANLVFTFDIQLSALNHTKEKLAHYENIHYIHDSFEQVSKYVDFANMYVFNLGYLPGGDKTITTKKEITLKTLKLLHDNILLGSQIIIMAYIGHEEGFKEYMLFNEYLKDQKEYQIYETRALHHDLAPILVWIQKKDSK